MSVALLQKMVIVLSVLLFFVGGAVVYQAVVVPTSAKAASAAPYFENWSASSILYVSGFGLTPTWYTTTTGNPASAYCGYYYNGSINGYDSACYAYVNQWQVNGCVGATAAIDPSCSTHTPYNETWSATSGWYTTGFSYSGQQPSTYIAGTNGIPSTSAGCAGNTLSGYTYPSFGSLGAWAAQLEMHCFGLVTAWSVTGTVGP